MNKLQSIIPVSKNTEYLAPDINVVDVAIEAGIATSFTSDPTIDDEIVIDPYATLL